jgi:ParB family chromosome partitioning protein
MKPKGLGRGLDALLGGSDETVRRETLGTVPIGSLQPGKYQPRTKMDAASLDELAASIRAQGLMQPILVRSVGGTRYEIIAGERRWRAARLAELNEVPVVVRDVPDQAALAMALIENIQRENLNPLEEATGIQRLVDEFRLTHEQAAEAVGRSRAAVSNLLRLLRLPQAIQGYVSEGKLDMGHARALLALEGHQQLDVARRVVDRGLSVRETEALVNDTLHPKLPAPRPKARTSRDVQRLEEELAETLGTAIEIKPGKKGSGKLVIGYMSLDHLDDLIAKLRR